MIKKKCFFVATLIAVLYLMILIFHFSGENSEQSSGLSGGLSYRVVETMNQCFSWDMDKEAKLLLAEALETPIRKLAHFMEYAILSFFVQLHLMSSCLLRRKEGGWEGRKAWRASMKPYMWKAALFCVLYACTDELHQFFVPGRACRIFDVGVDSLGILFGMGVFILLPLYRIHLESKMDRSEPDGM